MRALGNPRRLFFWWHTDSKMLFIGAANSESPLAIRIPPHCFCGEKRVKFRNNGLLSAMYALASWNKDTDYILAGEFIPELRMVGFNTIETEEGFHD
jgi:hypothetical protein